MGLTARSTIACLWNSETIQARLFAQAQGTMRDASSASRPCSRGMRLRRPARAPCPVRGRVQPRLGHGVTCSRGSFATSGYAIEDNCAPTHPPTRDCNDESIGGQSGGPQKQAGMEASGRYDGVKAGQAMTVPHAHAELSCVRAPHHPPFCLGGSGTWSPAHPKLRTTWT